MCVMSSGPLSSTATPLTPPRLRQEIRLLPSVEEERGGGFRLEAALAKSASVTVASAHAASQHATLVAATILAGVCVCSGVGAQRVGAYLGDVRVRCWLVVWDVLQGHEI